jgi:hypothetical protein
MRRLGFVLLLVSCAAGPKRTDPATARLKDTPADKAAAQNDADRDLQAEGNERRWGFEEARRRREQARKKSGSGAGTEATAAEAPAPASGVSLTPAPPAKAPAPNGARDPGVTPPPER